MYSRWDAQTERINATWVLKRQGRKKKYVLSIRLYALGQMRGLFETTGLEVEALYGDFTGEEYRRSSRRLIVVGRK